MTPPGGALASLLGPDPASRCALDPDRAPLSGVGSTTEARPGPGSRPVANPLQVPCGRRVGPGRQVPDQDFRSEVFTFGVELPERALIGGLSTP